MGHNVSRSKQASTAQDQRIADLARYAVPGWHVELGPERLVADATLLGALQRSQMLVYRCERPDCGRRVQPDLEALVRGGHGHLKAMELRSALGCGHPLGCGLKLFSETYPQGVPLVAYLRDPDAMVSVSCIGCRHAVTRTVPDTIDRLKTARRGDGSTGVLELAGRIRGPCRRCGCRRFTTTVVQAMRR
jgi:hypothetical protein